MAKSIAQQVADFLKSHPAASNTDLYQTFPKVRENTLRNYKYKFKNSVDQFRSNRKSSRPKKKTEAGSKSSSPSLRSKVFEFFKENPKASNQKLYEEFSNYSKNKLRHYKASFFKLAESAESGIKNKVSSVTGRSKNEDIVSKQQLKSLEKRIEKLERQMGQLNGLVLDQSGKPRLKGMITGTATGIEKKVRELEDSISGFIKDQRKKIKTEMSSLEEVQQLVTNKISSFIKEFK